MKKINSQSNVIVYLGTFPPRECGIATFSEDLVTAMDKRFNPATKSKVIALNETETSIYNYDNRVIEQISADSLDKYVTLAEEINSQEKVKLVNIQHEFGLFGGNWGDYLIPFLQVLKKPVAITFHSVLTNPDDYLRKVVFLISEKVKAVLVMNSDSKQVLESEYGVSRSKIFITSHGIPQTTFELPIEAKVRVGFEGKTVLSTFGHISVDKGIEYAIRALPKLIKEFPNILYVVLGATHPQVRRYEGEKYRNFLTQEVERLNLGQYVKFYNKYLTVDEIVRYLKASDVYISPMINLAQSVSGTLSYALGCGRPVVSTATAYAKSIVTGRNGVLVKARSADSIARALREILSDKKLLESMSQDAYENTRQMIWPNVAASYFRIYKKFADLENEENKLPEVRLNHLMRLTDDFGVLHHAKYSKPEPRYGYSFDDNARALIVAAKYYRADPQPEIVSLMKTYLNFIKFTQRPSGSFSNIVNSRKQEDGTRDEDVFGRGIWALGYAAAADFLPSEITEYAKSLFAKTLKSLNQVKSPRAVAFTILGLYFYLKKFPNKKLFLAFRRLADKQIDLYHLHSSRDWQWFEDHLTYSNSKLPESLFYAYDLTRDKKYLDVAQTTLKFLAKVTFESKHYSPIGQNGWYFRYKKRAYFDQQPEDTASTVETKVAAYKITKQKQHLDDAFKAFQWFLGKNHLNLMVYDEVTGGCHDGLGSDAMNLNQGAESTISYLMARLAFEDPEVSQSLAD